MTANRDDLICNIQEAMLDIGVGNTKVVFGVAVTRWHKDGFEVGTWGKETHLSGSEGAAEDIANIMQKGS